MMCQREFLQLMLNVDHSLLSKKQSVTKGHARANKNL